MTAINIEQITIVVTATMPKISRNFVENLLQKVEALAGKAWWQVADFVNVFKCLE